MPRGKNSKLSGKTLGRLCLYRHILNNLAGEGTRHVFSHELATMAGVSAAQVRRDLMSTQNFGNPTRGYEVRALAEAIGRLIDDRKGESVALIGIGNLGRAILAYFQGRHPKLSIVAAFDWDMAKVNRTLHGCICYPMGELRNVLQRAGIRVAVLSVPASEAQKVAETLVEAGIRGILNFAPLRLRLPEHVHVEDIDFGMSLEKVAYYARTQSLLDEDGR